MEALCAVTENAPIKVSSSLKTGITFQGYDVDNLGMDRLVDLVAAKALVGAPVMVVDLGTCTTVSVLDQDCVFRGGMILPGIQVSLDAMNWRAAKLPALQASAPQQLIGQNTAQCMQSGAVIGAAAVIAVSYTHLTPGILNV